MLSLRIFYICILNWSVKVIFIKIFTHSTYILFVYDINVVSERLISDITDINYYINMDEEQIIKTSLYRKKGNCILKYRSPNLNLCPFRAEKSQIFSTQFIHAKQTKNPGN